MALGVPYTPAAVKRAVEDTAAPLITPHYDADRHPHHDEGVLEVGEGGDASGATEVFGTGKGMIQVDAAFRCVQTRTRTQPTPSAHAAACRCH